VMFPESHQTTVAVEELSKGLCGAFRPGHFAGVATVVAKLFYIIGPCRAIFGRKDYQQLKIITRMAADLNMPVEVVGVPTIREADGLAMSSRNAYLSREERTRALALSHGLTAAHLLFARGERSVGCLRSEVGKYVTASADAVDYVAAADPDSLQPLPDNESIASKMLLAIAAFVGRTRLIDNTVLGEDEPPSAAF
jgi:pantoate--beta-alanine ligase